MIEETKQRYCGYCRKQMVMTKKEFDTHIEWCEKECCDRYYGGLGDKGVK